METALKLAELKAAFLKEWPLERLEKMSLEEYSNTEQTSFCYWLEYKTRPLGSAGGGSSFNHGIYKMKRPTKSSKESQKNDGEYAWQAKYGETAAEAFKNVRQIIYAAALAGKEHRLADLADLDYGEALRRKIAFLYSDYKVVNTFKQEDLVLAAQAFGYDGEDLSYSSLNNYLLAQKGEQDFFAFGETLWDWKIKNPNPYPKANIEAENRLIKMLRKISRAEASLLFNLMEQVIEKLNIDRNDPRVMYSLPKSQPVLALTIGQRQVIIYMYEDGLKVYKYIDTRLSMKKWIHSVLNIEELQAQLPVIIASSAKELERTKKTSFAKYNVAELEEALYNAAYKEYIFDLAYATEEENSKQLEKLPEQRLHFPNNQILFGPPGTGKTYNSINYALAILAGVDLEELNAIEKDNNLEKAQQIFSNLNLEGPFTTGREILRAAYAQYKKLGQIQFTTFHQSMSYEDFVEGIKPVLEEEREGNLSYEIKAGIFKQLAQLAAQNYLGENRLHAESSFDAVFAKFLAAWEAHPNMAFSLRRANSEFQIYAIDQEKGRIHFEKASGSRTHYLRIATLKEIFTGERDFNLKEGLGIYYQSILNALEQYATDSKIEAQKNYVLIIDEINRGNISEILGELITLLEEDKRLGQKESLEIVLPYSKDEFSVPPNLYIIGTMNTADRSVEALDAALRRRFSFVEMPPRPELLENILVYGYAMEKLLWTINQRIERLLSKDHLIGHSYFLPIKNAEAPEKELALVVQHKILPLLQEYFYGDFGKIGLVLGQGFVRKEEETQIFAAMDYEPLMEEERFQLIPWAEVDLEMALAQLGLEKEA